MFQHLARVPGWGRFLDGSHEGIRQPPGVAHGWVEPPHVTQFLPSPGPRSLLTTLMQKTSPQLGKRFLPIQIIICRQPGTFLAGAPSWGRFLLGVAGWGATHTNNKAADESILVLAEALSIFRQCFAVGGGYITPQNAMDILVEAF
jgi:hypothetical protein